MNRTKIEWTNYSWNPIVGCSHGCWYCYARKITQRFPKIFPNGFEPTFYPERLIEPSLLKKPSKIFCCSISDLFASWTPTKWRDQILEAIEKCPIKHTFQLLTKNPERIPLDYIFPENVWVGTTVTNEGKDWINIDHIKQVKAKIKFISFEPLLDEVPPNTDLRGIDWVIVGKLTGSKKVKLNMNWVEDIKFECSFNKIPIFMKNNLKLQNPRQEYPKEKG